MDPHEVLNPQSLADECGLTLSRIHQLIRAETIQATRLGKMDLRHHAGAP
jgi:hypothetical protein